MVAALVLAAFSMPKTTEAACCNWSKGDLFLGVGNGDYQVWNQTNGHFDTVHIPGDNYTTNAEASDAWTTGCAFDSTGNLYGTGYGYPGPTDLGAPSDTDSEGDSSEPAAGIVEKFTGPLPTHNPSSFGSGYGTPESIVFDLAHNVYVGNVGTPHPSQGGNSPTSFVGIREFDKNGNFIKSIIPNTRVDWFDIASNQDTIYYTQEGADIKGASISTGLPLTDTFTAGVAGKTTSAYALRILPGGGVLVADGVNVKRFDMNGNLTAPMTYNTGGENSWFSLNLDTNTTSFWSGNISTNNYYKFNIDTGAVEAGPFNTGTAAYPAGPLAGICLLGEPTVATTASITICKQTNPPGGTGFNFFAPGSPLSAIVTLNDRGCDTTSVDPSNGPFTFTEFQQPPGWVLANIVCGRTASTTVNIIIGSSGVTVTLGPGDNVTCTFFDTCATCDITRVGGTTELVAHGAGPPTLAAESSDPSIDRHASIAAGVTAVLITIALSGWYTRRRWLR